MLYPATTIDEVILALEVIIRESKKKNSRLGYFATLYLKVTQAVKEGADKAIFKDPARMRALDVIFANRYLYAYQQWQQKQQPTASWKFAFEQADNSSVLVLEHLLLGMSAHINLDLGIATVQAVAQQPLNDIHDDFDKLNHIISGLTYQVLAELNKVSPLLSLLGLHAGNSNSVLIQFSISNARDGAWCFAEEVYGKTGTEMAKILAERDSNILQLGKSLINQKGLVAFTIRIIHLFEWKNVRKVIDALSGEKMRHFTVGKNLPV